MTADAIGGYFGLELPLRSRSIFPGALHCQSARAALQALVISLTPRRIWVPWFICDSVRDALVAGGADVAHYSLTREFEIDEALEVAEGDWLIYVNYFGLHDRTVRRVLSRFAAAKVVIDNAQAFYSAPSECLATIYSPRKFFGVPDGGVLVTACPVNGPTVADTESVARLRFLGLRLDQGAEAGYPAFQEAEQSFVDSRPARMSKLTSQLLRTIDYEAVANRRRTNFLLLHAALGESNLLTVDLDQEAVPLCYPFMTRFPELRAELISARIFVPTYWLELLDHPSLPALERNLVMNLLPLPCDQRYGPAEMNRIVDVINQHAKAT